MMGKARKQSRGKSSGVVPDYMQSVEHDEYGYSLGFKNELEEAPAPKRSRLNLSLNGDRYGVPKEFLSLSNMSRSEKKNLVYKLNTELEQVRDLRKKIACISSDTVLLSPYSDLHSCSDGPRRPPPQEKFATFSGTQGNKRFPVRNDKQQSKKRPAQQFKSARLDVVPNGSTYASVMKECEKLLERLWSHKKGWAFRTPVDPVLLNIPDYFTVVKRPMDLGTIRKRLQNHEYSSPLDFAADVRLTFSNAIAYNPPGNQYHIMARDVSTYFETRWKIIEKKIPVIEPPVVPITSSASLDSELPYKVSPPRKKAAAVNESNLRVEPAKLVMTDFEKKKLSGELEALEDDVPQNIIDLLREESGIDGQSGEIEIDIATLSDETLFMVRKSLDDYLREKKKSQEKSEPCEMEIVHDSGFSNSPLQHSKGDLLIDEDVDVVGGNDPPVSSHPPLKIEKDAACSSSSSSESGSSSSDSDSCSSSGSESDSNKASKPTNTEDKKEPGVGIHRKDDDTNGEKIVVNDSLNELSQVEHDVGEKLTAMDAVDVLLDEETASIERQISPKRYRAALLKNRFADTILKAKEKSKGDKGDPEKLRIEREEFEKQLREEKVRLQAEAKAAEVARRKAKAEAFRKARREREQEREAARQALQKMEKTVEINEGRRFMEDLEMLRASAEGDQLPTFMEEMSPKFSEDMLSGFNLEGNSNPLEQLGLYMKMDEDEDNEEDEPHFSQGEADEQSLDRKESHILSPRGVEGDDQLVSENEELVSPKAQDNVNQEDEKLENVPLSPYREEGEDQYASGDECREEPVSQKANHEDEQLVNQNEEVEQSVNVSEQVTKVSDMEEGEAKVADKEEEEEAKVVDKGEEETEVVNMEDVETEANEKREEETETVADMGEVEETEAMEKREQESNVVDIGEVETEANEKREEETVADMREEEAEANEKREEETVAEIREDEAEANEKREEETVADMREEETEVNEKREEESVADIREEETEANEKREEETVADMIGEETEVVDIVEEAMEKRDQETNVVDIGEVETEADIDMGEEQKAEAVPKREEEAETVDMEEEQIEVSEKGEKESEVVGNGEEETQVVEEEID